MAVTNSGRSPTKFAAQSDAETGKKFISYMMWVGAAAAGDTIVVTDTAGKLIWSWEANGANYSIEVAIFKGYDGIIVSTMASGYLLVYFE